MNRVSMLLQTIEYAAAQSWGYYYYSVGYLGCKKFNCTIYDMRQGQSGGMARAV